MRIAKLNNARLPKRPQLHLCVSSTSAVLPIFVSSDTPLHTLSRQIQALPPSGHARGGIQITRFGITPVGHLDGQIIDQNGGYACAYSTQINYVSLLLDRLLRPVRAAARTRSRCLAQVRHPQDSGIL